MKKDIPIGLDCGRIIVTGGNGFIGSHVVDRLIDEGYEVTVVDRQGFPHRSDVNYVLGDIRDRKFVNDILEDHHGIINLAGILGTSETVDNPQSTIASNLQGALNIFDAIRDFKIRGVHITVGNYWMNNPYAITKNAAENIALLYNEAYGSKIAVVRGLNAYGERQKAYPVRKLMPNLLLPALTHTPIRIYGDGYQKMDMIYVGDLANVLVRALVLDHGAWNQVIEGGSGSDPSVNEICETVLKVTQSRSAVEHIPMRQGEPERAVVVGHPETMAPLGLGAEDLMPLEDGIRLTVNYYRHQILAGA
jgi:UDP-glucose 4-epimerase